MIVECTYRFPKLFSDIGTTNGKRDYGFKRKDGILPQQNARFGEFTFDVLTFGIHLVLHFLILSVTFSFLGE